MRRWPMGISPDLALFQPRGLSVYTEGVETLEDFLVVSELGVDQVQGFYFSRPLPADELVAWLQHDLNQCRKALQ